MTARDRSSTVGWCIVVCAAVVAWLSHEANSPRRLAWDASAHEVIEDRGPTSDATNYILAGDGLSKGETIGHRHRQFWKLGMPVVIGVVKRLGGWSQYPFAMAGATTLTWVLVLCILVVMLSPRGMLPWGAACAAAIWLYGDLRGWVLGYGAMMSEGMGAAWLLAGFGVLLASLARPKLRTFILAGVLLGVAANFRYQYLMLSRSVLVVFIVALLVMIRRAGCRPSQLWGVLRGKASSPSGAVHASWMESSVRGLTVCTVVFFLTLVPWSAYKLALEGTAKWYTASKQLKYGRMWTPDERQPAWAHAANAQCHADPELCAEVNEDWNASIPRMKHLGLVTTLKHPFQVAKHKLDGFSWLWWGKSWERLGRMWPSLLEGVLLLVSGGFSLLFLVFRAWRSRHPAYFLAAVGAVVFVLFNAAMFTFLHFEWRFSMPLRVLSAVGPWLMAGFYHRVEQVQELGRE